MPTFAAVQAQNSLAQPVSMMDNGTKLPGDKNAVSLAQQYDFSASGIPAVGYTTDLTTLIQQAKVKGIQCLFVDNSANNGFVSISNPQFGQSFSIPGGYQAYFPILAAFGSGNKFSVTSTGNLIVNVNFLNTRFPLAIWAALVTPGPVGNPLPVSDAILDATVAANRVNVTMIGAQATDVDRSGVLTAANTAQQIMAANTARRGYRIQNNDLTKNEPLYICTTGAAVIGGQSSLVLAAFGGPGFPGGSIDGQGSGAISIIGATLGHEFYAIEW